MHGCMHACMGACMDGWMDGWMVRVHRYREVSAHALCISTQQTRGYVSLSSSNLNYVGALIDRIGL